MAIILKCDCRHKFQDKTYGPQMRVHNEMASKTGSTSFRCTVCKKERGR